MLAYPHFAVQGLLLQNGYTEIDSPTGVRREYAHEDRLELCIARVLLRKPERLRGWDLRFLRRSLNLSQAQLGKLIDRDAQTVARWEKTKRRVPSFVDLAIRCRFAERFDGNMTLKEVLSFVDGTAAKLPRNILLRHEGDDWHFFLHPRFDLFHVVGHSQSQVVLPTGPGATQIVYATDHNIVRFRVISPEVPRKRRGEPSPWKFGRMHANWMALQAQGTPLLEFRLTTTDDNQTSIH